ncbi:MAG: Urea transporter, ATPase protein UrtE [Xanthobacteraceae bacterium]|nr:Urea transporter, ATPase protein UrtE [Xanthobacteraceae bacterium]
MTLLETRNLSGGYRALTIFSDVNLTIEPNTITGILGPNGAGKTTLLKTLAGLLKAQSGTIRLDGNDVMPLSAHDRARHGIALVPEGRQIFQGLTVKENLGIPRSASRFSAVEFDRRFEEILTIFPRLRERLGQLGGGLSGGEQQMLAIGRALLLDPKVLMLDEPTQGLAPIMVSQVLSSLEALRGRFSMLIVEQNRDFLDRLSNSKFVFRGGKLEQTT